MVWCSVERYGLVGCGVLLCCVMWYRLVLYGVVGVVWCGVVLCGVV